MKAESGAFMAAFIVDPESLDQAFFACPEHLEQSWLTAALAIDEGAVHIKCVRCEPPRTILKMTLPEEALEIILDGVKAAVRAQQRPGDGKEH